MARKWWWNKAKNCQVVRKCRAGSTRWGLANDERLWLDQGVSQSYWATPVLRHLVLWAPIVLILDFTKQTKETGLSLSLSTFTYYVFPRILPNSPLIPHIGKSSKRFPIFPPVLKADNPKQHATSLKEKQHRTTVKTLTTSQQSQVWITVKRP